MRVAHILRKYVPSEWGGTETALQRLTAGLAANDVDSVVYHPASGGTGQDPLAAAGCEMQPFHACLPVLGLSAAARHEMVAVGGNLLSFDLPWRLGRDRPLSVIHSHVLGRIGGIAGTVARRRRLPFVISIHGGALDLSAAVKKKLNAPIRGGLEWGQLFGWWWRARHVLADADAILTCNNREAALLHERFPNQHVMVQPHGVDTRFYRTDHRAEARAAFPAIAGRDIVLCVARLDPVKNQLWLLQQLPALLTRHPRTLLVLAGGSTNADYNKELHRTIRQLGVAEHVLLTGGLPPGDPRIAGLMQEARVAVLPSVSETFGLVVIEAWAAGLPILASRTTGATEIIRDGENGGLFHLERPEEFHERIDRVLRDPALRIRMAEAGERAADAYDIAALAGRVKALYAQLCEAKFASATRPTPRGAPCTT
jgi:starch synthase